MFRVALRKSVKLVDFNTSNTVATASFATYKTSTGLTGLRVDPNGRENLIKISDEILANVQKIPETSQYRINVEKWFKYIKKTCIEKNDIKSIETEIKMGQIEEILVAAQNEKELVEYYFENKGWELVAEAQAEADEIIEDMADSIYFSSPESRKDYVKPTAAGEPVVKV